MSRQAVIRRRILELLAHPRQVAMADVDLSECPHSGVFKTLDATCRQCAKNHECDWLNSTDEFNGLAEKEMRCQSDAEGARSRTCAKDGLQERLTAIAAFARMRRYSAAP